MLWPMPGSDVDVAGADRERHEAVAEEFRWRFAVGSTRAHVVDAPLKDAAAAEHLELEAVNGGGQPVSDAVDPIADVIDGHNALSIA